MKLNGTAVAAVLIVAALALAACSRSASGGANPPPTRTSTGTGAGSNSPGAGDPACSTGTLNAEGSTAQTNAINQWIKDYQSACSGATVNYNPTGSGAGVSEFTAGKVDFAGSDSALDPTRGEVAAAQKRCGSTPLDLPMVVGPIAIAYKLKGVSKLILNGDVTANIFLGKITTWNDPAVTALNPGVTLPATKISVFYRSDSSGTTQNFERYLAATAPSVFTSTPDKDSSKAGFAGQGKAKSQGVSAALAATDGSIGYDEFSFAVSSGLQTAWIDNGGGAVELTKDTASTAAEAAKITGTGDDLTLKLDYATKAAGAYPIILVTYELACTHYSDPATGTFVKNFLDYAVSGGQSGLAQLGYAPLPAALQTKVQASIATIS
ncbi:MAG: phosphate ABC transporter substrate-binding protein PstS [Jatrophihabitantaceae bacterium]